MTQRFCFFVLALLSFASEPTSAQSKHDTDATEALHRMLYLFGRRVMTVQARQMIYRQDGTIEHEPNPALAEADFRPAPMPMIPTVVCSGGLTIREKAGSIPLSRQAPLLSECDYLRIQGVSYDGVGSYQKAYDTTRLFIERCYDQRPSSGWLSIFGKIGGAASGLSGQNHEIWPNYRQWLKKVLYYNLDTEYYCADLSEIWGTFQAYNSDSLSEYRALTDRLAVLRYIIESGKCPALAHDFSSPYEAYPDSMSIWDMQLQDRRKLWEDSLRSLGIDPSTRTMDSTLPNIDDLGLGLLRGKPSSVTGASQQAGPSLLSVSALNNPFNRDLDLTVDMGREALVTVEMFDLLGNAVQLTGMKYMLKQSGPQRITVPVGSLVPGTYYLRVSTDWGDVRTVKVVKH